MAHPYVSDRKLRAVEPRAPAADAQARLHERDQRMQSDTRTPGQRLLGDPEPSRSALRQRRLHDLIDALLDRLNAAKTALHQGH
jgi:hypothetical protein